MRTIFLLIFVAIFASNVLYAQTDDDCVIESDGVDDGEIVAIPLQDDLITLDGDFADWDALPQYDVQRALVPSPVEGENDQFTFSVAADHEYLYVMMTTPDAIRVAGQHEGQFWNEDSFEIWCCI